MPRSSPPSRQPRTGRAVAATALAVAGLALAASSAVAAPPANDSFANAATIAIDSGGWGGITNGTNVDATVESGEPQVRSESSGSVWYKLTPTTDVPLIVDTCTAADFDTLLGVYTGAAVGSLTRIVRNDDTSDCTDNRSQANFVARAGTTYRIQVRGYGSASGTFGLRVRPGIVTPSIDWNFSDPVNPNRTPLVFDVDDYDDGVIDASAACRLDDGPAQPCDFPYRIPNATNLVDGPHAFKVTRSFGSHTSPPATLDFTVDTTPPTFAIVSDPPDQLLPQQWTFSTNEILDDIACTVDGVPVRCSNGNAGPNLRYARFDKLCVGPHAVTFAALDGAGNRSAPPISRTVTANTAQACAAPTFTNPPFPGADATRAFSTVDVDPHGAGARLYLEYGTTPEYGERVDAELGPRTEGSDLGLDMEFLEPGTTYYARWTAENASGRTRAAFTFTTDPAAGPEPAISLLPVTGVGPTRATLNATVQQDLWTTSRFEYGTTTAYGTRIPADRVPGGVTAELTGLAPSTTYHYRLHTIGETNRSFSADATFTTTAEGTVPPISPPPGIPPVPGPPAPVPGPPSKSAQAKQYLADALKRVKLTRKHLRKGGTVTVRVKTIGAGTVKLSGKVRRGKAKKSVALGSGIAKAKKAGTTKLRLKIAKKARGEARRKGKLTVSLTARFAGSGVKQTTASRTLKLR